jgi:4-amino-4-deoxy-L-arabinose transferase-like glycosyltransferase
MPLTFAAKRNSVLALVALTRGGAALQSLHRYGAAWFFQRGIEMHLLAESLLAGKGLASPFGGSTGPTAFIAPGYPLLVASVFRGFGAESMGSAVVLTMLQAALAVLLAWVIIHFGLQLAGERAGLIGGVIFALLLPLWWVPTIFWDTSFTLLLLLAATALAWQWRERMTAARWMLFGALVALASLMNPALLLALIADGVWLAAVSWSRGGKAIWLGAVIAAVLFSPWPIRNARVFHAFVPLRTTVGFELWMGNRDGSNGYLDESVFPMFDHAELNDYLQRGEIGYTHHKSALAQQWIAAHPAPFAVLTLKRFARYWLGTGTQHGSPVYAVDALLTLTLGVCGLWQLAHRERSAAALLALPLLLFPLPYYITHAEFRYRMAVDPLLCVLAGVALAAWTTHGTQNSEAQA